MSLAQVTSFILPLSMCLTAGRIACTLQLRWDWRGKHRRDLVYLKPVYVPLKVHKAYV